MVFLHNFFYKYIYVSVPIYLDQLFLLLNDIENLTEELLDVMQVVKGIAFKFNIDLDANIEKHNKKLLSRGHKVI